MRGGLMFIDFLPKKVDVRQISDPGRKCSDPDRKKKTLMGTTARAKTR